jgi:hypothetical protein
LDDPDDENGDDISFTGPVDGYLDLPPQQFIQLNQHRMKKPSGKPGSSFPSNPDFDPCQIARVPSELWHKLPPDIQTMLQDHNKKIRGPPSGKPQFSAKYNNLWSAQGVTDHDPDLGGYDLDEYPSAGDDGEPSSDTKPSYSIFEHVSGQNQLSYGDI